MYKYGVNRRLKGCRLLKHKIEKVDVSIFPGNNLTQFPKFTLYL